MGVKDVVKLFLDTEFTGLKGLNTSLISIALVSEPFLSNKLESVEFYAEFNDYNKDNLDDWIVENVINNCMYKDNDKYFERTLPHGFAASSEYCSIRMKDNRDEIIYRLNKWLEYNFNDYNIEIITDCGFYDYVLFQDLFGGAFNMPNILPIYHDINNDIMNYYRIDDNEAFDINRRSIIEIESVYMNMYKAYKKEMEEFKQHNALSDAKITRILYNVLQKRMDQRREYNENNE